MKAFQIHCGKVALLDRDDVDTDAIIPKQFMKCMSKTGLGPYAFDSWRYLDQGSPGQDCSTRPLNRDFELNLERYHGASILLTRRNFGCGSSREHAPWALLDMGIRAIIAESFGDIFRSNCLKNGILPITLESAVVATLIKEVRETPGMQYLIDLNWQQIVRVNAPVIHFSIPPAWRERLLSGMDEIALTLRDVDAIQAYEERHQAAHPWLFPNMNSQLPATEPDVAPTTQI